MREGGKEAEVGRRGVKETGRQGEEQSKWHPHPHNTDVRVGNHAFGTASPGAEVYVHKTVLPPFYILILYIKPAADILSVVDLVNIS